MKELRIIIGANYILNGDVFKLVSVIGNFFTLLPVNVKGIYATSRDGCVVMGVKLFVNAEFHSFNEDKKI